MGLLLFSWHSMGGGGALSLVPFVSSKNAFLKGSLVRDQFFWSCKCFSVFVVHCKVFCWRREQFSLQFYFKLKTTKSTNKQPRKQFIIAWERLVVFIAFIHSNDDWKQLIIAWVLLGLLLLCWREKHEWNWLEFIIVIYYCIINAFISIKNGGRNKTKTITCSGNNFSEVVGR